jgi:transcriptional regulator of acetoin/glycerol metabolism
MRVTDAGSVAAVPTAARSEIEESLHRCAALKLDRSRTVSSSSLMASGGRRDEQLRRVAAPVMDELCGLLEGVPTGVVLTNDAVKVIDVRASDPEVLRFIEDGGGTIGSDWSEETMGTTAVALAVKLRKPIRVAGDEHYLERLSGVTAAAAPIFDPFDRSVVGALNLSGPNHAASPHMLAAVAQAARSVEQALYEHVSASEHRLVNLFSRHADEAPDEALFAVNERMVLSNAAGFHLLAVAERNSLWGQALDAAASTREHTTTNLLTLGDGRSLTATFEKADPVSTQAGMLVRVACAGAAEDPSTRPPLSVVGRQRPSTARHLDEQIAAAAAVSDGVLIVGEAGAGKVAAAAEVHVRSGRGRVAIVDGAMGAVSGGPDLLRDLAAAASQPDTTLIIRHVDCLGQRALTTLRSLFAGRCQPARVIATMNVTADASDLDDLVDLFPRRFRVPALRDRREELAEIVATIMRRHGARGRMQLQAVQALAVHEWPGNVRELEAVVRSVVASRRTCDITQRDLPSEYSTRPRSRRLTRMEHVERSAIQQALDEAGGNRTRAAEILQIGRATLYRKMKSYGLVESLGATA